MFVQRVFLWGERKHKKHLWMWIYPPMLCLTLHFLRCSIFPPFQQFHISAVAIICSLSFPHVQPPFAALVLVSPWLVLCFWFVFYLRHGLCFALLDFSVFVFAFACLVMCLFRGEFQIYSINACLSFSYLLTWSTLEVYTDTGFMTWAEFLLWHFQ